MSICDRCIHDEVCGLEDNHEEGIVSCADMIPKDVLDKIREEIEEHVKINQGLNTDRARALCWCLDIIDKYKVEGSNKK